MKAAKRRTVGVQRIGGLGIANELGRVAADGGDDVEYQGGPPYANHLSAANSSVAVAT